MNKLTGNNIKYLIGDNVVFTPDDKIKLMVNGEVRKLPKKETGMLKVLLDNNKQTCTKKQLIDEVWGPGSHGFDVVRQAKSKLDKQLAPAVQIETVWAVGYKLDVELKIVKAKYPKAEVVFEKSPYIKRGTTLVVISLFFISIVMLGSWAGVGNWLNQEIDYKVEGAKAVFIRDLVAGFPQFSADGDFLAVRTLRDRIENGRLTLINLSNSEITTLAKASFDDGVEWDWSGNRIVYQTRNKERCDIRLIQFDANKKVVSDSLLTQCLVKSGQLSFAWFSEHEFYVNLVDSEGEGLPLHQLYSFDIRTKQSTKILTAKREGGVGYYSLEYDKTTATLYMLRTNDFTKTNFYSLKFTKLMIQTPQKGKFVHINLQKSSLLYFVQTCCVVIEV